MKQIETGTGKLPNSVGAPGGKNISSSWINPDKEKLMIAAGYFLEKNVKTPEDGK